MKLFFAFLIAIFALGGVQSVPQLIIDINQNELLHRHLKAQLSVKDGSEVIGGVPIKWSLNKKKTGAGNIDIKDVTPEVPNGYRIAVNASASYQGRALRASYFSYIPTKQSPKIVVDVKKNTLFKKRYLKATIKIVDANNADAPLPGWNVEWTINGKMSGKTFKINEKFITADKREADTEHRGQMRLDVTAEREGQIVSTHDYYDVAPPPRERQPAIMINIFQALLRTKHQFKVQLDVINKVNMVKEKGWSFRWRVNKITGTSNPVFIKDSRAAMKGGAKKLALVVRAYRGGEVVEYRWNSCTW